MPFEVLKRIKPAAATPSYERMSPCPIVENRRLYTRGNNALDKIEAKNDGLTSKLEVFSSPRSAHQEELLTKAMDDIGSQIVVARDILSSIGDLDASQLPYKLEVEKILKDLEVDLDASMSQESIDEKASETIKLQVKPEKKAFNRVDYEDGDEDESISSQSFITSEQSAGAVQEELEEGTFDTAALRKVQDHQSKFE